MVDQPEIRAGKDSFRGGEFLAQVADRGIVGRLRQMMQTDRQRLGLTAHKIGEIFGVRVTKKLKGKLHTTLERIEHGHHIFRAYFKHAFVKQYDPLRLCQETVWK